MSTPVIVELVSASIAIAYLVGIFWWMWRDDNDKDN